MPNVVVVDSNIYIGLLRRGIDPITTLGEWAGKRDLATCGMIQLEVIRGLRTPRIRQAMIDFFDVMIEIPTSNGIWKTAADIARKRDRKGRVIPSPDAVIAACALELNAALLTDDGHFDSIHSIQIIRPDEVLSHW